MKKTLILTLLTAVVALLAYYLYRSSADASEQITLEDRLFGVEDTDIIHRIAIAQKEQPELVFVREGSGWKMNNDKKVNEFVINDFLGLIKKVDINYIPTRAMTETIFKDIEKNGIRVRIWDDKDEKIRDFWVGTDLGDASGTPFLVNGRSQPYVMRIPGFVGSLRTRITNRPNEWESKDIYVYKPEAIRTVEIVYHRDAASSYKISKTNQGYTVTKPGKTEPVEQANQKTVEAYLQGFSSIIAEYNDSENPERATINKQPIFATVRVETVDGQTSIIDYFSYMDISVNTVTRGPHEIHPDNKFFCEANDGEFYLVQQRVIGKIFRSFNYFF